MSNLVHPSSYFTARKESATYCKGHLEGLAASLDTVVEISLNSLWKMNSDFMVIHLYSNHCTDWAILGATCHSLLDKLKWKNTYFTRLSFTTEDISKHGTTCFCIRKTFQYTAAIYSVHFWYSCVIINFSSFHFKIYHHLMRKKKRNNNRLSCKRRMVPEFASI